jgi:vacuolar-type H+-ATPase subunit E/Vma4
MARSALKAGVMAYEKGRETLEEISETVDDVVAEVEEELLDSHNAPDFDDIVEDNIAGFTRD